MYTLYVVAAPRDLPEDIPRRAGRILGEVSLILADDLDQARRFLAQSQIDTPLMLAQEPGQPPSIESALNGLEAGDVALLCVGAGLLLAEPCLQIVRSAQGNGYPVAAVPGPNAAIAALVISGLPSDSFVYLGQLPGQSEARCTLLAMVAQQRRTLVALELPERTPEAMLDLERVLGDRPLVVAASAFGTGDLWRGTVVKALEELPVLTGAESCTLSIGGASETADPWDQRRLRAEIQAGLLCGMASKEISRQLARKSGWPRREIYRLAVDQSKSLVDR